MCPWHPPWQDWKHFFFPVILVCMHLSVGAGSFAVLLMEMVQLYAFFHPFVSNRAATSLYLSWEMAYLCGDIILLHYDMMLLTHWCNVIMYWSKSMPRKQFHHMAQSCNVKSYEGAWGKSRPFAQAAGLPCKLQSILMLINNAQWNPEQIVTLMCLILFLSSLYFIMWWCQEASDLGHWAVWIVTFNYY